MGVFRYAPKHERFEEALRRNAGLSRWVESEHGPPRGRVGRARVPEVVRVRMLGRFSVSVGPRTIEEGEWRLRKAAALVKLLALAPNHRMHRERAMDLLWPELDSEAAANNLHQTLYVVRRVLATAPAVSSCRYVRLRGEQLQLCPEGPLWVDVEAFEDAVTTARRSRDPVAYRVALELYAGDLLPQDPYEHWAEDYREALRKTYLSLLVESGQREPELIEMERLPSVTRRSTLTAAGGSGKMRLALEAVYELPDAYPDGVWLAGLSEREQVTQEVDTPVPGHPPNNLTRREKEVTALVSRGLTNRQIAQRLTLSKRTIDNHVANILKKLNLPSRFHVAAWAEAQRPRGSDPF